MGSVCILARWLKNTAWLIPLGGYLGERSATVESALVSLTGPCQREAAQPIFRSSRIGPIFRVLTILPLATGMGCTSPVRRCLLRNA